MNLQEIEFSITYKTGKTHVEPNCLSHYPNPSPTSTLMVMTMPSSLHTNIAHIRYIPHPPPHHPLPYHQQANGYVECLSHSLKTMLWQHLPNPCTQDQWDTTLPHCTNTHNTSVQESLQETTFFIMHGFHPLTLTTSALGSAILLQHTQPTHPTTPCHAATHENLCHDQLRQPQSYNASQGPIIITPGDTVMICNLCPKCSLCCHTTTPFQSPL